MALVALGCAVGIFYWFKKTEGQSIVEEPHQDPELGSLNTLYQDEIIAVRKRESNSLVKDNTQLSLKSLSLFILAPTNERFSGQDVLQALISLGFKFGDMNIFHLPGSQQSEQATPLLSIAQAVEPGTFNLDTMNKEQYIGLTLFTSLNGSERGDVDRLNLLMNVADKLSKMLDGEIFDDKKRPMTQTLLKHYYDHVVYTISQQAVA